MSEPSHADVLRMLARMHKTAADSESEAGRYFSTAEQDQLSTKYRNAAEDEDEDEE